MKVTPYSVWKLVTENGKTPIDEFLAGVKDKVARGRILSHIDRMERGLFGDWKEVGGIFELRLNFGPGYRIYYGKLETVHIVLAGGSDKSDQSQAIATAKALFADLLGRPNPMDLLVRWGEAPDAQAGGENEEDNENDGTSQL